MKKLFRFFGIMLGSYFTFVAGIWGFLEAYTYFHGDYLRDIVGSYWVFMYSLPLLPAIIIGITKQNNSENFLASSETNSDSKKIVENNYGHVIVYPPKIDKAPISSVHDLSEGVKFKSVLPKNDEILSDKVWMIQGQRSRFFTGREDILMGIRQVLTENQEITALTGLAGIGKTKTAIEYAYVFSEHYTRVLWANGESKELCTSSFVLIADALDLPERNVSDQYQVVKAVQKWLENQTSWLLIFDSVQGLDL